MVRVRRGAGRSGLRGLFADRAPRTAPLSRVGLVAAFVAVLSLFPSPAASQAHSCPRPALARLADLAGRWRVEWSYLMDGQLRTVDKATATIDLTAGGCAVSERLEGELLGRPLALHSLVAATSECR